MNSKLTLYLFIILINIQLNAFSQNLDLDILKAVNKNETGFKNAYLGFNASAVNTIGIAVPVVIAAATGRMPVCCGPPCVRTGPPARRPNITNDKRTRVGRTGSPD
jgi:hypothetical protein